MRGLYSYFLVILLVFTSCKKDTVDGSSMKTFQASINEMSTSLSTLEQTKFNEALYILKTFGVEGKTDIQKLATSDMIPGVMVTTSSKMDKELQEKLEKALRDIEKDPKMKELFTKMFSITGFTDVDQDAYKKVEATAKVMNVDLDKVK